jgi:2-keto-4-pentenoate hydratase/2-oxohepta-3-ene-1,7-dioic acid hydratase in catechol pathway
MKIIRYQDASGRTSYGSELRDGTILRIEGDIFGAHRVTDENVKVTKLLAPVVPTQILGVGLNYRHHAQESGMKVPEVPVLFVKGLNTVQNPGDPILLPTHLASHEVDYECELAVVIGRACKNVKRAQALDYVLGLTCANDVSARDWQIKRGGGQWCRGKFFDTFCPLITSASAGTLPL